ncbi:hypothetical protein [Microbacterium sp.]|uniref:hypothetical protein n=1 Tax=Microbacterium sp. TaxID=51671 RepID=UPI002D77087D|nr:hypothetical protein [Microbacterium sp.]HET6299998.1 hypothetical protein [Microbacterium sp.]
MPDFALDVMDAVVESLHDVLDTDGSRSWEHRLEALASRFQAIFPGNDVDQLLEKLARFTESDIKAVIDPYVARFKNGSAKTFLHRLMGSGGYSRLVSGWEADWALCLLALRRLMRAILPLVQALEDAAVPLNDREREGFASSSSANFVLIGMLLKMDSTIESYMERRELSFSELGFPARPDESSALSTGLHDLVDALRMVLDVEAELRASELSDVLVRKLRGFEQALESSEDGIAQAASSLVEFVDRLLRTAFTPEEVLAWVALHYPGDKTLTYRRNGDGELIPTKRAAALCFSHAGQAPNPDSSLNSMLATTLVKVRKDAEQLKHADRGTPEEAEELRMLMKAMRGAVTFVLRANWILSEGQYERLQQRFAKAA